MAEQIGTVTGLSRLQNHPKRLFAGTVGSHRVPALRGRTRLVAALMAGIVMVLALVWWVTQRQAPQQSGPTNCGAATAQDVWMFNCLMKAYDGQKMAAGTIVSSTLEGDTITFSVTIEAPTRIKAMVDNRDRYGQPGLFAYACSGLRRIDQYHLSLTGCSSNGPLDPSGSLRLPD